MSTVTQAIQRSNAKAKAARKAAAEKRASGMSLVPTNEYSNLWADSSEKRKNEVRRSQFRGWLYSVIHVTAREGAAQPVKIGRLVGSSPKEGGEGVLPRRSKYFSFKKMPKSFQEKGISREWELLEDHSLMDVISHPNPIQSRWEFVYSFIANLCLTGWAFVVWDRSKGENDLEVFSLPVDWVTPIHKNGPFAQFLVGNPNNPEEEKVLLGRENVAVARMPDPSNLLGAYAPADSQQPAIRVDNNIQSSQEVFFENGVFPSVIVQIGKEPHPDVVAGTRPRLNAPQRRQIVSAIKSTMSGVANYGNPAIVDGMIESIEKLSMTQNELGWEKSEDKVRARILSAFGVHPFILGEPVALGGYAQAREIKERFYGVVNCYLDMLSNIMSQIAEPWEDNRGRLYVWWERLEAKDPQTEAVNLRRARELGDISPDEFRTELGFPPREEESIKRPAILDTPGGMQGAFQILNAVNTGMISRESAIQILCLFLQVHEDMAEALVGEPLPPPPPPPLPEPEEEEEDEEEELEAEMEEVRRLVSLLGMNPEEVANKISRAVS